MLGSLLPSRHLLPCIVTPASPAMLLRPLALTLLSFILASTTCNASPIIEGRANVDFNNPLSNGGSMLDRSAGLGEPLNVIISAKSTPRVLDMASETGAINFFRSIG